MSDIKDQIEESHYYKDSGLMVKIFTHPKLAFAFIREFNYNKNIYFLLILSGITSSFGRAIKNNMGDRMSLSEIIIFCILSGGFSGYLTSYIYAVCLSWSGKWLHGSSSTSAILRIFAFSSIPYILCLLITIVNIGIHGLSLFHENIEFITGDSTLNLVYYGSISLEILFSVWSVVLVIIGISMAQNFSIIKTLLNLIIPFLFILIPIFIVLLFFNFN